MASGSAKSAVADTFPGFASDSFEFFRDLAHNNSKGWFDQNRSRYEEHVVGAFRSLLVALEASLLELNPQFETSGKTNGNFSRINRDIRFSKDKSPYKPNYYLYTYDSRRDRQTDGRLYVGLSADCLTVGFATYTSWRRGAKSALESVFRQRFETHREIFRELVEGIVRKGRYETYWHREEQDEWVQHPGLPRRDEDWLTLQAWIVRKVFLPNARGLATPGFAEQVDRIFRQLYALYVFTSSANPKWQAELRRARPAI